MKKLLQATLFLTIASCSAPPLVTNNFDPKPFLLPSKTQATIQMLRFETGYNLSRENLVMQDGRNSVSHYSTHSAYLLTKNGKNYLIDTGLGQNAKEQFQEFPAYARPFFGFEQSKTIKEQIGSLKIDGIFFTHLHFDHASGAEDFGAVDIFTSKDEFEQMKNDTKMVFIKSQMDADFLKWNFLKLENHSYGPFTKSLDFFGDGSLVIVDLGGHTKGSLGYIVNTKSGRFFMVGDAVWTIDQIISNKNKSYLASLLVDDHHENTEQMRLLLHNIWMSNGDLKIIPSHDLKANFVIPSF